MIQDLVQDPARLNLFPSGYTTTNPPLLCLNAPHVQMGWSFTPVPSFSYSPSLHVPAAESVPEGMQSGQLLQAGAPAAGEGTGEQQPHHRTETEGRLRSGRCHRCGEWAHVWERERKTEGGGLEKTVLSWFYRLAFPSPHFTSSILVFFSSALLFSNITFFCGNNLINAGRCSSIQTQLYLWV